MSPNSDKNLHHILPSASGCPVNQRHPLFSCAPDLASALCQLPRCWQVSSRVGPVSRPCASRAAPASSNRPTQCTAELGSQDHRITNCQKTPLRSVQLPCNDQRDLRLGQIAQSLFIPDHECLQRWGIYYLYEKPVPLFNHSHVKNSFLTPSQNWPPLVWNHYPVSCHYGSCWKQVVYGPGSENSLQPTTKTMVGQLDPAAHGGPWPSGDPSAGGPQVEKPWRKLQPTATPCQQRVSARAAAWSPHRSRYSGRISDHGGPLLKQPVSEGLHPMMSTQAGVGEVHEEIGEGTPN